MQWYAVLWLVLFVFFIVAEANTVTVVSLWFAAGSLAALVASLFEAQLWVQVVLFFAVSILTLAMLRPFVKKWFTPKLVKTNVDAIIGTQGIVTEEIDNTAAVGRIKLGAMEWTARSTSGQKIPAGTQIKVDSIQGVKVFVTPVNVPVNQ